MAMLNWEARDGSRFTLSAVGYEHPDEELGPTEDNPLEYFDSSRYLMIECEFRSQNRIWTRRGPTLTTEELDRLRGWVVKVIAEPTLEHGLYFVERELELLHRGCDASLVVWACWDFAFDRSHEYCDRLEFPVNELNLPETVAALSEMVRAWPGRPAPL
jgi:hypothetical protein